MSIRVLTWALREAPVKSRAELIVLIVLAEHAHDDGGGAWPSVETIARLARLSRRGVQIALRSLELADLIIAKRRPGTTTVYEIAVPEACTGGAVSSPPGGEASSQGGRTRRPKGAKSVRPNRKEPSINREGDSLEEYDRGIKWS